MWRWLTARGAPGLNGPNLLRLAVRVLLFALVATLLGTLLRLTPVGPYLDTWWGSLLFILVLYVPVARYMMLDLGPRPGRPAGLSGRAQAESLSRTQRRKERNRYAGVRKGAPRQGGRR